MAMFQEIFIYPKKKKKKGGKPDLAQGHSLLMPWSRGENLVGSQMHT